MIRRLAFASLVALSCGPAPTPIATIPTATASATSTAAPPVAKSAYPMPPQQTAPWTAPATSAPPSVVQAVTKLFDHGVADPRDLPYREIEVVLGDVWSGGGQAKKTRGWVLPGSEFAVAWNGLVYRVKSVGATADLKADMTKLLAAATTAHRFPNTHEEYFTSAETPTSMKAVLLLRLGEGDLAAKVWDAFVGDDKTNTTDPFVMVASDWLWSLYDRGITAHMRGDDELVVESWRKLPALAKLVDDKHAAFLEHIDELLAEAQQRANAKAAPKMDAAAIAALAPLSQEERVRKLVAALDQVAARQWGQPGGVSLADDPIVQALIKEGEPAVEPLIDAFENDTRHTRSVQFWRDFARSRSVIAVYEAAYIALSGILDASFFEAVSTGDHLTARGVEGRREVGKKIREHWAKWKGVPIEERFYRTLADDQAGVNAWLTAAAKITQPSNVQIMPSSNVFQSSMSTPLAPGQKATLRGESLRTKVSPSVTSLFATRLPAMTDARQSCAMAEAFAAWDPKAALAPITLLTRSNIASFATTSESKTALGVCIADLTTARSDAGDASAISDYASWVAKTSPKDADFDLAQWFHPMVTHPTSPAIASAARTMFVAPSPWVPFTSEKAGYTLERILELDLYKVDGFRKHVLAALVDKSKIGTITMKSQTNVEVKTAAFTSSRGVDANDPAKVADGTVMDLRTCDEYAVTISSASTLQAPPPFRIYWSQADRDHALAAMVAWVRTR